MAQQDLTQPSSQNESRRPEFDSQKSDSTSRAANTGLKPDEQKNNATPRANEIYEEELPPESRVVSKEE